MMKLVAVVAIAGCGGHAAPEPLGPPPAEPPMSTEPHEAAIAEPPPGSIAMPRPPPPASSDLDLVARWPLGFNEHPEDEPSFDIAGALADPGVTWRQLCARGVQFGHRATDQDLIAYLNAWCTEDIDDAVYQLGLLQSSSIRGIASAIAPDVARRLVHVSADAAEGALMRAHLSSRSAFDLLAASYVEVGELDEARAMNEVSLHSTDQSDAATCHRLARGIAIASDDAPDLAKRLHRIATPYQTTAIGAHVIAPDSTCVALDRDVGCSVDIESCGGDTKLQTKILQNALTAWPSGATTYSGWYVEFDWARGALPNPYAATLATAALQAQLLSSECDAKLLAEVRAAMTVMRTSFTFDAGLDHQLDAIDATAKLPLQQCLHAIRGR
ncbi:MAG TPA: hypothetical protein VGG74_32345 [Kofleriaceae bacterium]|jgi:hypothetical protein